MSRVDPLNPSGGKTSATSNSTSNTNTSNSTAVDQVIAFLKLQLTSEEMKIVVPPSPFSLSKNVSSNSTTTPVEDVHPGKEQLIKGILDKKNQAVGSKILKFTASDYAFQSYPDANTSTLTKLVASQMGTENLRPLLSENGIISVDHFQGLLTYVARKLGPPRAAQLCLPHFSEVLKQTSASLDLPNLIASLRTGTSLQSLSNKERVELLQDELFRRGIHIHPPRDEDDYQHDYNDKEGGGDEGGGNRRSIVAVDVTRNGQCDTTHRFFSDENAVEETVMIEARKLVAASTKINRLDQMMNNQTNNPANAFRKAVCIEDLEGTDLVGHYMWVMHMVRMILRLKSPFKDKMEEQNMLPVILQSRGWIPMRVVTTFVLDSFEAKNTNIERPSEEAMYNQIHSLLLDHDNMQRFQVAECQTKTEFFGMLCARSIYAHELRTNPPLYTQIVCEYPLLQPQDVPANARAWILVERKIVGSFAKKGHRLFDNCQLLYAVATTQLTEFVNYVRQPESLQYDEKLGCSNCFFLEVDLEYLVKDVNMVLRSLSPRNGQPGHTIILPGTAYARSKGSGRFFPIAYYTGKFCEVQRPPSGSGADMAHVSVDKFLQTGDIPIPVDPVIPATIVAPRKKNYVGPLGLDGEIPQQAQHNEGDEKSGKEEKMEEESDTSQKATTEVTEMENVPKDGGENSKSTISDVFSGEEDEEEKRKNILKSNVVEVVQFDDTPVRRKIVEFHDDPERIKTLVTLPKKSSHGGSLFGRVQAVKELKEWIVQLGLIYREQRSTSTEEELLISKKKAFGDTVVIELQQEIGVQLKRRELLEEAITKESVNRDVNYERLEFIGDAVLDFVVMFDASLVFEDVSYVNTVTTLCCRNAVLCDILPRTIDAHLKAEYGDDLNLKTRADIFESIVGALYEDRQGLDVIRFVISRLFNQLPERVCDQTLPATTQNVLRDAMLHCPYLGVGRQSVWKDHPFNCLCIVSVEPSDKRGKGNARDFVTINSHKASFGHPRIQDKDHATHFTTGRVYSYRRIFDPISLHNKILSLWYKDKDVAYVNEALGDNITLTFDVDGMSVDFCGVKQMIAEWFAKRFRSQSMGILLDCSGMSVVSGKMKRSCHIHFPQIPLTVTQIRNASDDLRAYIVRELAKRNNFPVVRKGQMVLVNVDDLHANRLALPSGLASSIHGPQIGRVILSIPQVLEDFFTECVDYYAGLPSTIPTPLNDHFFQFGEEHQYMRFLSLVECVPLLYVSKEWRRRCIAHIYHIIKEEPYKSLRNTVSQQQDLSRCCLVRLLAEPTFDKFYPFFDESRYLIVPFRILQILGAPEQVENFVRYHKATICKSKPKDYFENIMKLLFERDCYGGWCWDKTIDRGLCESKKLRMYLCDKFDTVYGQEFRPLLMKSLLVPCVANPSASTVLNVVQLTRPPAAGEMQVSPQRATTSHRGCREGGKSDKEVDEQPEEEKELSSQQEDKNMNINSTTEEPDSSAAFAKDMAITFSHRSILELTSLRSAQFHGMTGTYDTWEICNGMSSSDGSIGPNDAPYDPNWSIDFDVQPTKDPLEQKMPSFQEISKQTGGALVEAPSWDMLILAVLNICPWKKEAGGNDNVVRHGALHPCWWKIVTAANNDAPPSSSSAVHVQILENDHAYFYVGDEAFLKVRGTDFNKVLGIPGKGMEKLFRLLVPHVEVTQDFPPTPSARGDTLPMFIDVRLPGARRQQQLKKKVEHEMNPVLMALQRQENGPQDGGNTENEKSSVSKRREEYGLKVKNARRAFYTLFPHLVSTASPEAQNFLTAENIILEVLTNFVEIQPVPFLFITSDAPMFLRLRELGQDHTFHPASLPRKSGKCAVVVICQPVSQLGQNQMHAIFDSCTPEGVVIALTAADMDVLLTVSGRNVVNGSYTVL